MLAGTVAAVGALLEDQHWLSDCVGGLLLASIVLMLGFAAARRHVRSTRRVTRLDST
jgi:membrane-associated phospholipid phosphatase